MNAKSNNRRKFIENGFRTVLAAGLAVGTEPVSKGSGNKVKLLDKDGNLVEVDEQALNSALKKKASDKEVQNWTAHKYQNL